jgi:hypothetical protein
LGEKLGLALLLATGTFYHSRFFRFTTFFLGTYVLSMLMKIMHLPAADELMALSLVIIFVIYAWHFIAKDRKRPLDCLKLTVVSLYCTYPFVILLHIFEYEVVDALVLIKELFIWITLSIFIFSREGREKLFSTPL